MKVIPLAVLLFIGLTNQAFCPNNNITYIPKPQPIVRVEPITEISYNPLIDAIFTFESARNTKAFNPKEKATGGLQIIPARVENYNKLTGNHYTLDDMYNFNIAKEVFLYYTNHSMYNGKRIPPKSWEQIAKDWNGSGKATEKYWNDSIKPLLKK